MKGKLIWLVGGVVAGIVFRDQITKLPLVSKIPTV